MGEYERLRELLPDAHDDRPPFRRRDIPTLIRLVRDSNLSNRGDALLALAKLRARKAVPAMIRSLEDQSWIVRCDAAEALGAVGDRRAIPALRRTLKSRNSHVRFYVAGALADLKDLGSLPRFDRMYKGRNFGDRISASAALYALTGKVEYLDELGGLVGNPANDLRYAAFYELERVVRPRDVRRVMPWLRRALRAEKESPGLRVDLRRVLATIS